MINPVGIEHEQSSAHVPLTLPPSFPLMTAPRTAVPSRSVFPIPFSGRGRGVNHEMICLLFPTTYLTPSIFTSLSSPRIPRFFQVPKIVPKTPSDNKRSMRQNDTLLALTKNFSPLAALTTIIVRIVFLCLSCFVSTARTLIHNSKE